MNEHVCIIILISIDIISFYIKRMIALLIVGLVVTTVNTVTCKVGCEKMRKICQARCMARPLDVIEGQECNKQTKILKCSLRCK